jgi:nitrogen fixation/metabolism regulation signal transduction histidine kinase
LAASQQKLEHSRLDLELKNLELDERRRYIETVLERIATGVVSFGGDGRIETINSAALRLLDVDGRVIGSRADSLFLRDDLQALEPLMRRAQGGASPAAAQERAGAEGRQLHL